MKKIKQLSVTVLAVFVLLNCLPVVQADNSNDSVTEDINIENSDFTGSPTYAEYINRYSSVDFGNEIVITDKSITELKNAELKDNINDSEISGIVISDDGTATWSVSVPNDALYNIKIEYSAYEKGSGDLEMVFLIDGKAPFDEASVISLNRTYEQPAGDFKKNVSNNEIKPDATELLIWSSEYIIDTSGYQSKPFAFYFSAGTHTITLSGSRGTSAISAIHLLAEPDTMSYKEYRNKYSSQKAANTQAISIQAEHFNYKNTVVISPKTDRTSPITYPQSVIATRLNTVGGTNWKAIGDSITWKTDIEESGLYKISLRVRQNVTDGTYTCRKLYIDDEVPFTEAGALRFKYNSEWQAVTLGLDGQDFEFYFEKGEHTIKLEAVAGDISATIGDIQYVINELYRLYRRIVMITGSDPDKNRDYFFDKLIPEEIKLLGEYGDRLQKNVDFIDSQAGKNGSYTAIVRKIIVQLNKMSNDHKSIAGHLERFKSNLGSVNSWLLSAMEQPLELDVIEIFPSNTNTTVRGSAGFFKNFIFTCKSFVASFVTDYNSLGSSEEGDGETIKVWIQTGRDQAEIIRELVDSDYSEKYNNSIHLSVVTGGLLQSVLARQAPDVVFDLPAAEPMEYALRGAAYDLTQFKDYNEVAACFHPAAVKPATYNGGTYAIPQTFSFFMFFYRTDIFNEYGFEIPKTWNELISMIPTLQRNGMEFGLPKTINSYAMFLNQRGGEIYKDDGEESNLDSNISISTFVDFTEYFTLYDLSVTFDFVNRFRSGEMPCAVSDFINYNQLTAFAPEIKGRWRMIPVPGTADEGGEINYKSNGTPTYIMILKNSEVKQQAWDFVKWFMSDGIQSLYGIKMEGLLGSCAKVATANINALSKMTWSSDEYNNLFKQYENIDSLPQVPGGYYLARTFDFAFNRVYNGTTQQNVGEAPSSVLSEYIPAFNEELQRKRAEFGRE